MDKNIFTQKKYIVIFASLCCLLWGSSYPAVKVGYEIFKIGEHDIPTKLLFAGYRFTLAGILVLIANFFINKTFMLPKKREFVHISILGFFLTTIQYIFFYIGLSNTTGVNGAIVNGTSTFFAVLIAHFYYKNDKLNLPKIIGCLLGFLGIIIINFSSDLQFSFNFFGEGFLLIATFVSTAANVYSKELSRTIDVMIMTGFQLFIGGLLLILLGEVNGGLLQGFNLASTSLLIYMGFLSAGAFTLWTILLKYNKVGEISVYQFLIPIFGTVLSGIFLNESFLNFKNLYALAFVSAGIYIVNKLPGKEI